MTNTDTELYELCKQVYEATGWENTPNAYYVEGHYFSGNIEMPEGEPYLAQESGKYDLAFPTKWVCPLYTSDYLLEKLPSRLIFHNNDCAIEVRRTKKDKYMWSANIRHSYGQYFKQISDTPLKALLKLTLKLHEEKIL